MDMNIEEARKNLEVGDWVRVDGYACDPRGFAIRVLPDLPLEIMAIRGTGELVCSSATRAAFVNLALLTQSVVAVIPDKPEPKVGEWRCGEGHCHIKPCEVYRSTGWSKDERKGERRKVATVWGSVTAGMKALAFGWGCDREVSENEGTWFSGETVDVVDADGSHRGQHDFHIRFQGEAYDIHQRNLDPIERRKADRRKM